jgi:hypothetical protein
VLSSGVYASFFSRRARHLSSTSYPRLFPICISPNMRIPLLIWLAIAFPFLPAWAQEPSPVTWFLDEYPIPDLRGTGITQLFFYDNRPEDGLVQPVAGNRRFVLRRAAPPMLEMEFDSAGQLLHAIHNAYLPEMGRDTIEVHLRQIWDGEGRLAVQEEQRIDPNLLTTISRDSTYYLYSPKGYLFAIRKPHPPWLRPQDTIPNAVSKYSRFRYDRKGRLLALVKQCDPSADRPSGMLVECARDSFLYDGAGRIAEILSKDIAGWEPVRHFLYDAQGRLRETAIYAAKNPFLYVRWRYDAQGRPVECVHESADGFQAPRIFTFGYDRDGVLNRYQVRRGADRIEIDLVVEAE